MPMKNTDDRQNKILEIIISSYVHTAEPVGSRLVSKSLGLSSATIRNVMADLEEMDYITHPHTSAGRVPTDKGYRRYIESLARFKNINKEEVKRVEEEYRFRVKSVEDVIKKTADVLSSITHQTGVVLFPRPKKTRFKRIELVSIGKKKVLVVLITSTGIVRNFIIDTKEEIASDLERITNLLNSDYRDLSLEGIKERLIKQLRQERDSSRSVVEETSGIIESMLQAFSENEFYIEGASYLLSQPEFENMKFAKAIMHIFDNKGMISMQMARDLGEEGVRVHIGKENKCRDIQNCSLVTAGYHMKDELIGRLGIIGPTRMAYNHLIPLVGYIAHTLSETLNELSE